MRSDKGRKKEAEKFKDKTKDRKRGEDKCDIESASKWKEPEKANPNG